MKNFTDISIIPDLDCLVGMDCSVKVAWASCPSNCLGETPALRLPTPHSLLPTPPSRHSERSEESQEQFRTQIARISPEFPPHSPDKSQNLCYSVDTLSKGSQNNAVHTQTSAQELSAEDIRSGDTVYRTRTYTRDALGRIVSVSESWADGSISTTTYTYDAQGQLVSEVRTGAGAYRVSYTYDRVGNRLTRTRQVGNEPAYTDVLEYNEANQLVSFNGQSWTHDADGNVVVRRANGETWQLGYDSEGNLTSLQKAGDSVGWVYTYDGLGRRVRRERGGVVVNYLYSADIVLILYPPY